MKEIRHEFTEAQHGFLAPLVNQAADLDRQIQRFIEYVAAENHLVKPPRGWTLRMDPSTGKPYIAGEDVSGGGEARCQ